MATVTGSKRHLDITSDTLTTSSNVDVGAKLFITTTDSNTTSTTALVLNGDEVEARTLGSMAFAATGDYKDSDTVESYVAQELTAYTTTTSFGSNAFTSYTDHTQAGYLTTSDVVIAIGGNDLTAGTEISLAGGLSYNATTNTLSQADNNTTYSAGTLLDLSGTTFNVDLSELTNNTATFAPTQDHFVILDNGTQYKKLASSIFGSAAYEASTAFATASHTHGGVYVPEYEALQPSGSDQEMNVWRKTHAVYSDNSGISTYIVIQTEVPQDSYSMGGFTLVYQDDYNSSGEGGEIKIYGYWNPESNGGFVGFRYECSNPYHTPTIEVCRNSSSGNTAFFISGEGGNYTQLIAKDLWLGYSASSATQQWGNGWTITEASDKTGYTNFDTLNRNDFPAITTNGSTPSLTGGVSAAEVRSLIGAGTSSSDTTYSAGTGLTLTNTTFSVTANTYAAASHNHDDRYYTETESDARYARGVTKSYSSVDTASDVDSWYKFFTITDSGSTPVICFLRGYAHSSVSFIVSEGYQGGNAHVQILDYLTSTNNNYKWIKGVRVISNGDVEVLLNGGATVSLEMTIIGDASYVSTPALSSAAAGDVKDSVTDLTNGMFRAKGTISGGNTSNWDTAYTHSQAAHAPSNAEQNVQSDWNETTTTSDAFIKNKPTLGTASASAATDFVAVTGDSMSGVLSVNYNGIGLEVGNSANSGADTGVRIRGARNGQSYSTGNLTSYILLSNFDDNTTPNNYDLVKIGGGMYDANSDTGFLRIETNNGTALTKALDIDKNQDAKFYGDIDADGNITASNLNVSNWDTAYGWGNHASAGYSTATGVENNADVTDSANVAAAGALMASGNTLTGTMKVTGSIIFENDTDSGYIPFPKGAQYQTKTGSHTGAIKITLPTHGGDDMVKFAVDIYDYSTGESVTMFMGGYIYQATGGNEWVSCTVTTLTERTDKDYTVRFGADGTNSCVWIGETNSTWSYPQVIVRDFYAGFISDIDAYDDNWSISFVTSFDTVDETISDNLPTADWDRIEGKPGNATTSVDGFMSSTDKTKLDGISSGADVTPSWVPATDPSYITGLSFDGLSSKTSGTGDYSTTGDLQSGRSSGGVALTINDGYGNANITWNHRNGTPEQTGNAARIEVNTDSSTGATMWFEIKSGMTSGTAASLTNVMKMTESGFETETGKDITSGGRLYISTLDTNTDSTAALVLGSSNEIEQRALGDMAFSSSESFATADHGHSDATTSASGFMSSTDKSKLDGVASGADVTPSWVPSSDPSYLTALPSHNHNDLYYTESELQHSVARALGWVSGYGNASTGYVNYDFTEDAIVLSGVGDSSTGAVYKAIRVKSGDKVRFTVMIKGSVASSDGMYIRLYQFNGNMSDGKTHVSNNAGSSEVVVVEDSSGDTGWYENGAVSDSWTNYEHTYTAPADGYVSLVVLNWTGFGQENLYIRQPDIQFEKVNDASKLGGTAASSYLTGIAANSVGITELNVSDGTSGQVLTTNGSGTLSFATVTSGSDTNYYLDGIARTDGTDTLVFSVNGATNQSYTFGSNAFTSYTDHTEAGYLTTETYTAHEDTSTLQGTYGSVANGTKIDEITVDANGHITAITTGATGNMTGFYVEDGDGTEVQINNANEWKFVEGGGIDINWTDTSTGSDTDPYDLTFTLNSDLRGDVVYIGGNANNYIQFDTTNNRIDFYAGNVFVARMESDGDLHIKGDIIAFSSIFA